MLRFALTTPNKKKLVSSWDYCSRSASGQEENMSLDTLLEAARYLELQELKEQQQRQALAPLITTHPQPSSLPPQTNAIIKPKQEPGISSFHHQQPQQHQHSQRIIQNSFDIINPLVIDEGGEQKRKQPPLVFRSGTREVHNKLEKHQEHISKCFDFLKKQLPAQADEKKTSNLSILHSALRFIQNLKRKERELEHEMERLARDKIAAQQRLAVLKKEIAAQCDVDISALLPEQLQTPVITSSEKVQEPAPPPPPPPPVIERVPIPHIPKPQPIPNGIKENNVMATNHLQPQQTQVQTAALSVVPMTVSQSILLHKVALVPKELSPLTAMSSHVAHFITAPTQQINGKVLPVVNAQYVVKPVVVVSSPPSAVPRPS